MAKGFFKTLIYHLCLHFQLERVGIQHQAGSDSYLTGAAFFRMKQVRYSLNVCLNYFAGEAN